MEIQELALNEKVEVSTIGVLPNEGSFDFGVDKALRIFKGHAKDVYSVTSLGTQFFVSGSGDCTIKLWSISQLCALRTFEGHNGSVMSVCGLDDENFVSGSLDQTVRLWNIKAI